MKGNKIAYERLVNPKPRTGLIRRLKITELKNHISIPVENSAKETGSSETQEKSSLKMKQNFSFISDKQYVTAACFNSAAPFFNALTQDFLNPDCSPKNKHHEKNA